jgi:(2Fe-2S) ferredoxin
MPKKEQPMSLGEQLTAAVRMIESALTGSDSGSPSDPALGAGIIVRVTPSGEKAVMPFTTGIVFLVCTNERPPEAALPCCALRGGSGLLEAFRAEFARRRYPRGIKVIGSTCLTSCQCGPTVVVYPDAVWYGGVTPADVPELFEAHLGGKGPVERLLLPEDVRVW